MHCIIEYNVCHNIQLFDGFFTQYFVIILFIVAPTFPDVRNDFVSYPDETYLAEDTYEGVVPDYVEQEK